METLFVGGGPATLGILSNAYHTNRIEDLITGPKGDYVSTQPALAKGVRATALSSLVKDDNFKPKGIAIVETSDQFGGGNLQKHFGIKSNTSASGFLKVIMIPKQASQTAVNISEKAHSNLKVAG